MDEWYNVAQIQFVLAKYPQETSKILHRDIFCFFSWEMRTLFQKPLMIVTLTSSSFLSSKVRLAKKLESSKATANHIKQVAGDPQAA